MRVRRGEDRALEHVARPIIVEPIFAWLEARDDRMTGFMMMRSRMLMWRRIAAPDVAALRAPSQVEPPCAAMETLYAAGAARCDLRIDAFIMCHIRSTSG